MAAASADHWYRRSRSSSPDPATPPIPTEAQRRTDPADVDSRIEVVSVDVAGTIAWRAAPPGPPPCPCSSRRGHAAIGRSSGGDRRAGRPIRLLREMLIDELGVRVLEEFANRDHDDVRQEVLSRLAESLRRDAEADLRDPHYRVSIVVASLDRPDALRECLDSLCRPSQPTRGRDRGGRQQPRVRADRFGTRRSSERGTCHRAPTWPRLPRNAGFLAASGEILVTTDDDVQVPEGWLDLLLEPFQRNDVRAVCGNVQPIELTSPGTAGVRGHGRTRQGIRPIREPLGEPTLGMACLPGVGPGRHRERGVPRRVLVPSGDRAHGRGAGPWHAFWRRRGQLPAVPDRPSRIHGGVRAEGVRVPPPPKPTRTI